MTDAKTAEFDSAADESAGTKTPVAAAAATAR